jgi:hypothetical protein
LKEINTDGELLQDFFDEYNKLYLIANKIKFSRDITSAVTILKSGSTRKYQKK